MRRPVSTVLPFIYTVNTHTVRYERQPERVRSISSLDILFEEPLALSGLSISFPCRLLTFYDETFSYRSLSEALYTSHARSTPIQKIGAKNHFVFEGETKKLILVPRSIKKFCPTNQRILSLLSIFPMDFIFLLMT